MCLLAARRLRHPVGGAVVLLVVAAGRVLHNDRIAGPEVDRGDAVLARGPDGAEIGRGLIAYDAADDDKIKRRPRADTMRIPGQPCRTEMISHDHLALGVFFYLVLTPIGVAMRIFGRDPLERRLEPERSTYWVPYRAPGGPGHAELPARRGVLTRSGSPARCP